MLSAAISFLKDLVFPITCLSCGKEGEWCCAACLEKFSPLTHQHCPSCPLLTPNGEVCAECLPTSHLDGVTALYNYHDNLPLTAFIKTFKYHSAEDSASILPTIIRRVGNSVWESFRYKNGLKCMPVPLHARRERERGFNQAERIADALITVWQEIGVLAVYDVLLSKNLSRVRFTKPQAELNALERHSNLLGAFAWNKEKISPKSVLLIDDVFTTGSTMQECARELKRSGAQWVWGVALARG